MYKLSFFVPVTHCEPLKQALFNKGAGRTERYDQCCWQVLGEGQFRPLAESKPFLGEKNKLEKVAEYKVEILCEDNVIAEVVEELLNTHPYQQPAYEVTEILTIKQLIIAKKEDD